MTHFITVIAISILVQFLEKRSQIHNELIRGKTGIEVAMQGPQQSTKHCCSPKHQVSNKKLYSEAAPDFPAKGQCSHQGAGAVHSAYPMGKRDRSDVKLKKNPASGYYRFRPIHVLKCEK